MNVSLTPELEKFVQQKVKTGRYLSVSEVIREALRLLEERDMQRQMRIEKLRQEVAVGIEQSDRGEIFDGEEVVAEILEEIELEERAINE
ncbi:MAG: type II toxin-antitoxin system ParD family antitoxin [Tychonema bourrellyi B0820]|uniref:Type II toxin-antitoxin system ParD family antitoxin n=1 Tax=Tychonema bourrellyi FEM_GT703 TaxID=2040638 RepID=A0A2G4EY99_9CYAN|nr:type II toxin-antitoxin system ParD family antitoxin [Tychonema bourrellyi]MDQ2096034.1 type II toxin-antitoxin system ParD family antitoxin [Tychonema bourrellyi B0820]PHX54515.1 type II toxin-antitoxin system ParD family antitoxin [Tychonema bourrellyi FEM_GT703]